MAEYLRFVVKEQKLSIKGGAVIYSDTISYIGATFLFNSDWDGLDKVLHLQKDGDDTEYEISIVDDKVDPSTSGMNLSSGIWQFWVHGTLLSGTEMVKRMTTNKTPLEVKQSGVLDGEPLPTVKATVSEQVLAKAKYAEQNAVISAAASIDATSGTPTVAVSFDSQTETGKRIKFAFTGLKGPKGDKGDMGASGDFDTLENRPSYNGTTMTHSTNIPEVKTSTWDGKQDAISDLATIRSNASEAAAVKHEHSNKSTLDTYTQTETDLADAVSKKHEHSNKSLLDVITQALINTWNTVTGKLSEPSTEGNYGQVLTTDGNGGRYWANVQGTGGSYVPQGIGASTTRSAQLNEDPTKIVASTFTLNNEQSEYHGDTFKAGTGTDTYDPATNRQGKYAVVMNEASFACGDNAFAHGHNCVAKGDCSEAAGESTVASGGNSRSMGRYTVASGFNSLAEGWGSVASGNNSRAGGYFTKAVGSRAYSNGVNTVAAGENSFTSGEETSTGLYGFYSVLHKKSDRTFVLDSATGLAVGDTFSVFNTATQTTYDNVSTISAIDTTTLTVTVTAWGSMSFSTTTIPTYFWVNAKPMIGTHLLNDDITGMENYGFNSSVFGKQTSAIGNRAFANGYQSRADGNNSFASGFQNVAEGAASFVAGSKTTASGNNSLAEGYSTTASGPNSHAEGRRSVASGNGAHAEGYASDSAGIPTTASGTASHAEGACTRASGDYSHSEGSGTTASGYYSHAEGSVTTASGAYSHAEGNFTDASGAYSHSEGANTTASGSYSHAEGRNTTAGSDNQHVQGQYNVADSAGTYADIVGWGTSPLANKNISALTTGGTLRLKGDVYINCNDDSTGGTLLIPVPDYSSATEGMVLKIVNGVPAWATA